MKKKLLALLLAIFAVVPLLVACSGSYYKYDKYDDKINLADPADIELTEREIKIGIQKAYHEYFSDEITAKTYTASEVKSGQVRYGDTLNIDYSGYVIGESKPFEGGTATSQSLEIGSGKFIDGFEDGLIDYEIGETVRLYLTFPEDYGKEELNGKDVYFDVTINKITGRYNYPEMSNAEVKKQSNGDVESVDALKENVKKNLIWGKYYDLCKVSKWPEKELRDYYETSLSEHKNTATYIYGSLDSYASAMGYTDGNGLRAYIMQQARQQCKQDLMVLAFVEKNKLELSDDKLEKEMKAIYKEAKADGYEGSYRKYLREYDESAIRIAAYTDVVMTKLLESVTTVNNLGKNGFITIKENGASLTYYYINGEKQMGWKELNIDGTTKKYFFDPELGGLVYRNVAVKIEAEDGSGKKYHKFGECGDFKGIANNEIIIVGPNKYMYIENHDFKTGIVEYDYNGTIDGKEKYIFGADGYMYLGVMQLVNFGDVDFGENAGKYYNFGTSGVFDIEKNGLAGGQNGAIIDGKAYKNGEPIISDTFTTDGKTYYFNAEGKMVKADFVKIGDYFYYFDNNGEMVKGESADKPAELEINGILYVIDAEGHVTSSTCTVDGEKLKSISYTDKDGNVYYFDENGEMVREALLSDVTVGEVSAMRYFDQFGKMAKGTKNGETVTPYAVTVGGVNYLIDENGVATVAS